MRNTVPNLEKESDLESCISWRIEIPEPGQPPPARSGRQSGFLFFKRSKPFLDRFHKLKGIQSLRIRVRTKKR